MNRNKYGAKKAKGFTTGRMYDSTAERDRAEILNLLQVAGEISDLKEQTVIELMTGVKYRPDFDYEENGRRVYEDVKGVMTERFRIICAIWRHHGPGPLRITKRDGRGGRFKIVKTVNPDYKVAEAEGPPKAERNIQVSVTPE